MPTSLTDRIDAAKIAASSAKETPPSKGRMTIRRNGSPTGATGKPAARIIKRWNFSPAPDTTLARLETAYTQSLSAVDLVEERAAKNKTNGKFTAQGAREDLLSYALNELVPNLHKARLAVKKARAEVAERKSKLKVEPPDPSNLAGASRRREIRDRLREMKEVDQPHFFARHGGKIPSEVVAAVLEMPPEFSGVPPERHEWLRQSALASRYGSEMAELLQLDQAIDVADMVVELGREEVRLEIGGIDTQKFDALAAPIEARHAVPWLRRRGTDVHVVDLDRRVERKPTDEELANGIFANTHDEYLKEQTTVPAVE